MRASLFISAIVAVCLSVSGQENQIITAVPNLQITDVRLADQNGNMTIEANENCDLLFNLKNQGGEPARTMKITLTLINPDDLNIRYKKSRSLGYLKPKSGQEIRFPITAGASIPEGIAEFKIEIREINGFDAYPATLELKTAQGNVTKITSSESTFSEIEDVEKKTNFILSDVRYVDYNGNSILEAYETSQIQFRLFNISEKIISDVACFIEYNEDNKTGIKFQRTTSLRSFGPLEHQDISIPIKGRKNILNGKAVYSVYIREPGGIESDHQTLEIVTRKYELPVLRISRAEFYGLDGKEIQLNEPFELALEIENRGTGTAFHVDVEPKVTNENIRIESNIRHTIPEIPGGQSRKVTFQFQANKHYIFPGVYIRIEITEGFNDLFQDEMVATSIQIPEEKKPPVNEPAQAITEEIPKKGSEEAKPAVVKVIPDLELLSHEFIDEDKNHIINYKESCEIKFRIKNSGSGVAEGVTVITKQLNMAISRLSFEDSITLGNLGPNQEVPVSIPIRSTGMMPTDLADFRIEVVEANGWDAVPLSFTVKTEKLLEPSLAIVNAEFLGESGKIERNEDIELRVTLRNSGEGDASDVNVQFQLPNNSTCFLVGDAIDEYNVKKLRRGESRDFSLFFITNRRYTDNEIPVKVDISESLRKHGIDTVLVGNMNEEVQAIMKHEVQPRIIDQPARTEPPIVVRQEAVTEPPSGTEILTETQVTTTRGGGDPLKSLGYEEAMNEIGIEIGKYIALIIGIDDYQGGWQPLKNAVHDAKAVENMLETKYKFDYVIPLYNGMATEEQIILQLNWLTEHVTPDDNVLIFYSGHGEFNDRLNRGYWVPVDAQANSPHSYISNSDIQDYLAAINSKHTLLISDACFSGDIFRGETISIPKVKTERYFREVHSKPSRQAITSGGIEPVMDGGKGNHSVFTYYLLQSLEKNDEIFFDASQLYSELKIPVVNNSSQYPDFQHIEDTGDEGGQFIFIKK